MATTANAREKLGMSREEYVKARKDHQKLADDLLAGRALTKAKHFNSRKQRRGRNPARSGLLNQGWSWWAGARHL